VLERVFPGCVTVEREVTSVRVATLLATQRFDIIHLIMAVDHDKAI
jgi:hypothetical protein